MAKLIELSNRVVDGYHFAWDQENEMFECRGRVMYDNDHDEMPEPALWKAAMQLEADLLKEGYNSEADHSEKGWVEVSIRI